MFIVACQILGAKQELIRETFGGCTSYSAKMAKRRIREEDIQTLVAYANHNMNGERTAKSFGIKPQTVYHRLDKIQVITGKNPRDFYQLYELINNFKKGIQNYANR